MTMATPPQVFKGKLAIVTGASRSTYTKISDIMGLNILVEGEWKAEPVKTSG